MAEQNPTDAGRSLPLDLRPSHIAILRSNLRICLEGVRVDLRTPCQMPNPDLAREEAAAYERLLSGLGRGQVVVPDEVARRAVEVILRNSDEETNYAAIVARHDAFTGLLSKLTPPEVSGDE